MKLTTLDALFQDQMKDIFNGEAQLLKALPQLAKGVTSKALRQAFSLHARETKGQVRRLQQAAKMIGIKLNGKKCKGMEGLIAEGKMILRTGGDPVIVDMALVAGSKRVEHYEITSYQSLIKLADMLGHDEVVELLRENLNEELKTSETLEGLSQELSEQEVLV